MTGMSDYLEDKFNNALFNNITFAVTLIYVSLHESDPGDTSGVATSSEVGDSAYVRKSASFGTPITVAGTCANDAEVLFEAMADVATITVTHFGLWDAATTGNYLGSGALATSKQFSQGDVPRFPIGSLVSTMA